MQMHFDQMQLHCSKIDELVLNSKFEAPTDDGNEILLNSKFGERASLGGVQRFLTLCEETNLS